MDQQILRANLQIFLNHIYQPLPSSGDHSKPLSKHSRKIESSLKLGYQKIEQSQRLHNLIVCYSQKVLVVYVKQRNTFYYLGMDFLKY